MGLTLTKAKKTDGPGAETLTATYKLTHSNSKTTLDLGVDLVIGDEGTHAVMAIEGPVCATSEEAMDKLAEWLERASIAIRERKAKGALPLFR